MRIAVVGAGGVGGFFGALLAKGGADVRFLARGAHLEAMLTHGLRIEGGPDAVFLPDVWATSDPHRIGPVDLVLVCVKLWDAEQAAEQIRPLVGPDTTIVSFQNGVLKDDYLRAVYDERHLMGGVAYVATSIARPGVIEQTGSLQRLVFGEFDGSRSPRAEALQAACAGSGINAEISDDIRRDIWRKFVFLVGLSATTTTMRVPIGTVRENSQTRAFLHDVMNEVVIVGRAHGVRLPEAYAAQCLDMIDGLAFDMTSSMHHDLNNGKPLEVRWLSGAVVELGGQAGIETPLNRAVTDILTPNSSGRPSAGDPS